MRTLDDVALNERDRRAIVAAARLLRDQFGATQVVLFGSKARGDDVADSDIDLLVLTPEPPTAEQKQQMRQALYPLQLELGVCFSRLFVSSHEWNDGRYRALPIHAEIDRDGVAA
jgi:predicted nucleotidyltransferase